MHMYGLREGILSDEHMVYYVTAYAEILENLSHGVFTRKMSEPIQKDTVGQG